MKRKNTCLLTGIGVVFILIVFGIYTKQDQLRMDTSQTTNTTSTLLVQPPAPETTKWEVEIFDTEYRPKSLTVRKGETVTWTNKGTRNNWPASDNHPTHAKYPIQGGCIGSMFDACKGLAPGESYTFQFYRTGEWNYHDHLAPGLVGTISVEP